MAVQGNPLLTPETRLRVSILLPAGQERRPWRANAAPNRGLLAGGESPQALQGPGGGPRDPEEARTRQPHAWTLALLVGSPDSTAARVGAPGPRDSGVVAAPAAFPSPRTPGLPAGARALHPDPSSAPMEPLQRHLQAERERDEIIIQIGSIGKL